MRVSKLSVFVVALLLPALVLAAPRPQEEEGSSNSWGKFFQKAIATVQEVVKSITTTNGYDSPPYTVVEKFGTFEEREYEDGFWWACTKNTERVGIKGTSSQFWKLFKYIDGDNKEGIKIPMTVPVSMERIPISEDFEVIDTRDEDENVQLEERSMCFFIGPDHQANPPTPVEDDVYLEKRPGMTVYTREVGGYMNEKKWKKEREALSELIKAEGLDFETDRYFNNGYDSPMKFYNRRNEVWLVKKISL